jgi:hypothetical protein
MRTIIPAAPGFVFLILEKGHDELARFPVVAWSVDNDSEYHIPEPVTIRGVERGPLTPGIADFRAVLNPDGTVVDLSDYPAGHFESVDDWLTRMVRPQMEAAE